MQQNWTEKKERGSEFLLRFIVWIAKTLGRPATRALLYPITLYFMLAAADSRRASVLYLSKVLPHKPRWRDVFRHFHSFSSVVLDRLFFLLGRADLFDVHVMGDAYDAADSATTGNGVFLMGAHLGSFEVLRLVARKHDAVQLVLLMYEENAKKIGALMAAINPEAQQEIVSLGNLSAMLVVKDRLAEGAVIGILADRILNDEKCFTTPFFGRPANLPLGPFKLAAMMRRPVFLMVGLYQGKNRYDVYLEKIADFGDADLSGREKTTAAIEAAMRLYVERLEYFCRLSPYNWFNFYDFWQNTTHD
ncbi:MAG: acyl-CoA synthetase [Pseudomonadota bacterium]